MVRFNYTDEFKRQAKRLAKRYRSLPDDIDWLQTELKNNPNIGVSLGGGKRKIRLASKVKVEVRAEVYELFRSMW